MHQTFSHCHTDLLYNELTDIIQHTLGVPYFLTYEDKAVERNFEFNELDVVFKGTP